MSRAVIVADVIRTQARQLKMPALARTFEELARQASAEHWPHQDYLHEVSLIRFRRHQTRGEYSVDGRAEADEAGTT